MFRRSFSSILFQQQKTATTVAASASIHRTNNNNNNNNGNTAQRFGDLLRNNNNNVTPSSSTTNTATANTATPSENRPFVRDIRSLRNRVKLDDFVQKRNDIAKLLLSNMNNNNNNNGGLSSSLVRASFDDLSLRDNSSSNVATIASMVNEHLHNMSDRNGHILSDELIFQSLRINAESGDIVTTAEILKRIIVEEGRLRNVSSPSVSPSILDALNAIDLLLQSVLNLTSSSSVRSVYSEIVKNSVNSGSSNIINVARRGLNNPYLQLRIDNKNQSSDDQILGGPLYSSLRCHVESIVKNIMYVFVNNKSNQIHPGLESLFATAVHVAISFDLFDFNFKNQVNSSLNILNVFSVIEHMSKSTSATNHLPETSSFELLDGALFSVYRQIFFAANVLASQTSPELLDEATKYLKKIVVDKNSSFFPFSSLWIDEIETEKNAQSKDGIHSLIENEIQLLKSFDLKNEDSSSDQISIVTEYFEKIFNSTSNHDDDEQKVSSLSSDEKYLLPLLLLIVAESNLLKKHSIDGNKESNSTSIFYSETFNILRKIISLSSNQNNNNDHNILGLSFDLLAEVFAKSEREILFSMEPVTLDQVNAPFGSLVEEKIILKNVRLSLLAHQLFDQAEVLVSSSSCTSSFSQNSNEMDDVVGASSNLKNSLANFCSIVERYLVKDDSDLGQQIALLEERKSLRKQEISSTMTSSHQQQNNDGSDHNGGEVQNSSSSENMNTNNKDDFDDDFSTSTTSSSLPSTTTTNNNNKLNNSKKVDDEDEFDKILSNQNNKNTKESSSTNFSENAEQLMDGNFDDSSSDSHSHPSLRILALQRRQRKICNNNNNKREKYSKLHELLFSRNDDDEIAIVAGLSSSVFNRIFKNSRDAGDTTLASSMSEKRRSLYDPVKLI